MTPERVASSHPPTRSTPFGHGVIKILTEGDPLALGDLEMFVGFAHGAASVFLWAARGPANHLGHIVFEARRADAVMRFVNRSVRIQDQVVHNPINEVVDHGGNRIDPAETVIERRLAGQSSFSHPSRAVEKDRSNITQ